jgi:hypothetical protein
MISRPVIGILFAACAALAQQARIFGQVVDITGGAIPNATVTLIAGEAIRQTTTDNNGNFQFASVAPRRHELRITSPGFAESRQVVVPAPGADLDLGRFGLAVNQIICFVQVSSELSLQVEKTPLERQIFISGRVAAQSVLGTPVAGATITLRRSGVATATVITGADGTFNFPFVPLSDYEMQIQAKRFRPQTIRLSASSPDKGYVGTIALAAN